MKKIAQYQKTLFGVMFTLQSVRRGAKRLFPQNTGPLLAAASSFRQDVTPILHAGLPAGDGRLFGVRGVQVSDLTASGIGVHDGAENPHPTNFIQGLTGLCLTTH
jgi:hypothetical protein